MPPSRGSPPDDGAVASLGRSRRRIWIYTAAGQKTVVVCSWTAPISTASGSERDSLKQVAAEPRSLPHAAPIQKFSFSANWMIRGLTAVDVIVPKADDVTLVFGLLNCVV